MRTLGNILWHFPFLGFLTALWTFLVGSLLTLLVVTAPVGLGLLQLSKFFLMPYSFEMVSKADMGVDENPLWKTYSFIIMILYLPIGCILAIWTIIQVVGMFCTIVGIPQAIAVAKAMGTYFNPVGKICVPVGAGDAMRRQRAEEFARRQWER